MYNVENMVPHEKEAVLAIPDGKLWPPGHVSVCKYLGLVLDILKAISCWTVCDEEPQRQHVRHYVWIFDNVF